MKKSQLTVVLVLLMVLVFFFGIDAQEKQVIEKTFKAVENVHIRVISGDCEVKKGKNGEIKVRVVYTYPADKFKPVLKLDGDTLLLKEDFSKGNKGDAKGEATWTVTVPEKTDIDAKLVSGDVKVTGLNGQIDAKSASGDVSVADFRGDLGAKVASGDIEVVDSRATFRLSCASGDIRAEKIQVTAASSFKTASGDISVTLAKTAEYDMDMAAVSGEVTLDYAGNKVKGLFTFSGQKDEIKSDIPFEEKEEKGSKYSPFVKKSFTVGASKPKIALKTVSGQLILKK